MAKKPPKNWANDPSFKSMRSRGKCNSIELYVSIPKKGGWWEIITKTKPTKGNCAYWDDIRDDFNSAVRKGSVVYKDYFPHGENEQKVAHLIGDERPIRSWLNDYAERLKDRKKYSRLTELTNGRIVKRLTKEFGHMYLSQLKRSDVASWLKKKQIVQDTVGNILGPLHWCIVTALDEGIIERDILHPKYPKAQLESEHVKDAFTPQEVQSILNHSMPDDIKNMITFWLYTGLRSGELYGLTWRKWDKIKNTILIDVARVDGEQRVGVKSRAGTRRFKLHSKAILALQQQEKITKFSQIANPENLVFLDMRYSRAWDDDFSDVWKGFLEGANVRYRRPYNMRQTHITMRLSIEGEANLELISRNVGHEETKTTRKSYVDNNVLDEDWSEVYNMVV